MGRAKQQIAHGNAILSDRKNFGGPHVCDQSTDFLVVTRGLFSSQCICKQLKQLRPNQICVCSYGAVGVKIGANKDSASRGIAQRSLKKGKNNSTLTEATTFLGKHPVTTIHSDH